MSKSDYDEFLVIAEKAVKESGKILMDYFGKNYKVDFKVDNSPVTIADTESEKNIIKLLNNKFPDHSILGEESGANDNSSDYLWVIDPLDGTSNFSNDIPYFCISVGLLYKKDPILALVFDPIHNDLFTAYKDGGSYLNGKKIDLQMNNMPKTKYISIVYTRNAEQKRNINKIFINLNPPEFRMRNMGAAALELAYVSSNKLHGIYINGNNPWDVCAGVLLVQEAGGIITDFENNPWSFDSANLIASPKKIHERLIELV